MAPAPEDTGMGSQYELPYVNALIIVAFLTVAWYNVVELTILIQTFFKRYAGFYFWSLHISNWGIFFHALGMLLKFYRLNSDMPGHSIANTAVSWVGWCAMVTGQSIVLYSRLHLVAKASWTRWVLVMIIVNGVVLHLSTGVLTFLTNVASNPNRWLAPYSILERVQVSIFFIQEVVLSVIYIWKTTVMLRAEGPLFNRKQNARGNRGRKVLVHTIIMSFVIICLDITLLGLEFSGLYDIQTSYKGAVYSVKLKMEFTILNQLMNLVRGNLSDTHSSPFTGSASHKPTYGRNTGGLGRSTIRGSVRAPNGTELGNTAGAYARMDDHMPASAGIKLQNLKANDVLKTMTTEVRVDKIDHAMEDVESIGDKDRRSASSSEVYIISPHKN